MQAVKEANNLKSLGTFGHETLNKLVDMKIKRNTSSLSFKYVCPESKCKREMKLLESGQFSLNLDHIDRLKRLNHENLELIHDAVAFDKKHMFIVNEYVGDESLKQRIRRQALFHQAYIDIATILDWIGQLVSAIDHLHANHIVHKSINLDSIYLLKRDDDENKFQVKLTNLESSEPMRTKKDKLIDYKAIIVVFYQLIVLDETLYDTSVYDLIIRNIQGNLNDANNGSESEVELSATNDSSAHSSRSASPSLFEMNVASSSLSSTGSIDSTASKFTSREANVFVLFQSLLDCINLMGEPAMENNELINNMFAIKLREFRF